MRIYIAMPLSRAEYAQATCSHLSSSGFEVVSSWHSTKLTEDPASHDARSKIVTDTLFPELDACDALLVDTREGYPCGTFVEIGYALARGADVVWVQNEVRDGVKRTNIFDAATIVVSDMPEAFHHLRVLRAFHRNHRRRKAG